MFTIKEWQPSQKLASLCAALHADYQDGDRAFVLEEGEPKAVGILSLYRGTKVLLKGVFGELDPAYRDLMVRALLNVCRNMNPICLRVHEQSDYYADFGFVPVEGGMEVQNTEIVFEHH